MKHQFEAVELSHLQPGEARMHAPVLNKALQIEQSNTVHYYGLVSLVGTTEKQKDYIDHVVIRRADHGKPRIQIQTRGETLNDRVNLLGSPVGSLALRLSKKDIWVPDQTDLEILNHFMFEYFLCVVGYEAYKKLNNGRHFDYIEDI